MSQIVRPGDRVMPPEGAVVATAGAESLWLLRERAAFWPRRSILLAADVHLGKAAAFRHAGVPVPSGTTGDNLDRLTDLIASVGARSVVFLGDLVHNRTAAKAAGTAFVRWRERHRSVEMMLVRGNHDRHAGELPAEWNLACVAEPHLVGGLALCHVPQVVNGAYALAGHVHPAANLTGRGREFMRLPCFHFGRDCAILPAFGAFTGMADVAVCEGDRVYVATDSRVIEVQDRC